MKLVKVSVVGLVAAVMLSTTLIYGDHVRDELWLSNQEAWKTFVDIQTWHAKQEASGRKAPAGDETWEIFWNSIFRSLYSHDVENPDQWIEKVLELRREQGLPEIEVYAKPDE